MEIFNVQIFGDCAKGFLELCCSKKKEWIKTNTNQSDDALIDEFLQSNYIKKNVCCAKCGEKYKENDFSKDNVNEITIIEPAESGIDGGRNSVERPKKTKGRKD
jgi:hypothetical protein